MVMNQSLSRKSSSNGGIKRGETRKSWTGPYENIQDRTELRTEQNRIERRKKIIKKKINRIELKVNKIIWLEGTFLDSSTAWPLQG